MDTEPTNEVFDTTMLDESIDESHQECKEFLKYKVQLDIVVKVIDVCNKKLIDESLTTNDLANMDKEVRKMIEYENELPPRKMKSHHVPYRVLSLKMIQESYRLCNWLLERQCNESDNLFTADTFIDKILEACSGKEDPMNHINNLFKGVLKNTDYFDINFLGNIKSDSYEVAEPAVKLRKEYKKVQKRPLEAQVVPDEVEDSVGDNELEITLMKVKNCLKRAIKNNNGNPISMIKFAIDPLSLTYTVENIFYLSSLVKDGYVRVQGGAIDTFESATLTIAKKMKDNDTTTKNDNIAATLFTVNYELWKYYVKKFNITERMIVQEDD